MDTKENKIDGFSRILRRLSALSLIAMYVFAVVVARPNNFVAKIVRLVPAAALAGEAGDGDGGDGDGGDGDGGDGDGGDGDGGDGDGGDGDGGDGDGGDGDGGDDGDDGDDGGDDGDHGDDGDNHGESLGDATSQGGGHESDGRTDSGRGTDDSAVGLIGAGGLHGLSPVSAEDEAGLLGNWGDSKKGSTTHD